MAYQIIFTNDPSQRTWEKPEVNVSKKKMAPTFGYIRGGFVYKLHSRLHEYALQVFLYPIMGIHIKQQVW